MVQRREKADTYLTENMGEVEKMEESVKGLTDSMESIDAMMQKLQDEQTKSKAAREEYEKKHGIEDGEERLQKALQEARERQANRDQVKKLNSTEASSDPKPKEIAATTIHDEL